MTDIAQDINMMHKHFDVHTAVNKLPAEHKLEFLKFRFKFLQEELTEGTSSIEEKNPEEIVDSLIDLVVVACGTLDLYGVDFNKAWKEVLDKNMQKEVGVKAERPNKFNLPDLCKPEGWTPPCHEGNHGILPTIF